MRENQLSDHPSAQQLAGIQKDLNKISPCPLKNAYLEHYGYPMDTLPIGERTLRYDTLRYDTLPNEGEASKTPTPQASLPPPPATATPSAPPEPKPKAAVKKPPKEPKVAEPLPMPVQVFVDSGGSFPSGKLQDGTPKRERAIRFITEHVTDDKASLDLWAKVVTGYCAQWSSSSYTVMVNDYYLSGRIPGAPNNNGGGYAASRNSRGSSSQGFGLRRQPGDKGAPEPTETERAEFLAAQAALAKQAAINAQGAGRTYLS
jgi:hypothetical protein